MSFQNNQGADFILDEVVKTFGECNNDLNIFFPEGSFDNNDENFEACKTFDLEWFIMKFADVIKCSNDYVFITAQYDIFKRILEYADDQFRSKIIPSLTGGRVRAYGMNINGTNAIFWLRNMDIEKTFTVSITVHEFKIITNVNVQCYFRIN
jgi:hypothetical protein